MTRLARQRRRRYNRTGPARILLVGGGIFLGALLLGVIGLVGYVLHVSQSAPALASLRPIAGGSSSEVFAADGTRLGFLQSDRVSSPVGWKEIPANLKEATVAIEDQRFYKNDGVDLTAIFRAAIKDISRGAALQGGSTITMQLMRNLYLGGDQHTLKQKIVEAKLAFDYNKVHTKHEILTAYLNSVPYGTVGGQTAVGVQAAARIFFDRPVSKLDLAQAALLAGLPQAPSEYNPFHDPSVARHRRNEVLAKMAQLHYISQAAAASAEAAPLGVKFGNFYSKRRENFFFEYVRQQLIGRYGARTVAQGGLKVYTTIDLKMQRLARKAISEVLNEPEDPAAAIVTLNPANGDIEAMAESKSYAQSQYNLAAEGHRQPGSTFKAIDLADALSRGVNPNSTYYLSHTLSPGWLSTNPSYEVKTFEGTSLNQSMNLVTATLHSDNTVYAQLAADLGEQSITEMAYELGVTTHLSSYPAEALGGLTLGVSPLEMADVYATLADGGWRNTPIAITKVVFPGGRVDTSWGTPHRTRVLSEAVTAEETSILEQNVQSGTATRSAINCPTAAKTGTTEELVDAWLDGYTPNYSTVVWMGYPNKRVPMTDVHGEPQQGGYLPAEIWHDYMSSVVEGKSCVSFPSSHEAISYQPFYGNYMKGGSEATHEGEAGPGYEHLAPNYQREAGPGFSGPQGTGGSPGNGAGAPAEAGHPKEPVPLRENNTPRGTGPPKENGPPSHPGAPQGPGAPGESGGSKESDSKESGRPPQAGTPRPGGGN
jgi:penicillin-binding protein 1A